MAIAHRRTSWPVLFLAPLFTASLVAWAWSYQSTSFLDHGELLVIAGRSVDIYDVVFSLDDVRNSDDAYAKTNRAAGWYSLRQLAVSGPQSGAYYEAAGGFGVGYLTVPGGPQRIHLLAVPLWAVWLPTGLALTTATVLRRRRGRRIAVGRCAACGYDLRGSPGRCPECGTLRNGSSSGGST